MSRAVVSLTIAGFCIWILFECFMQVLSECLIRVYIGSTLGFGSVLLPGARGRDVCYVWYGIVLFIGAGVFEEEHMVAVVAAEF